jgi:hypothetical protein
LALAALRCLSIRSVGFDVAPAPLGALQARARLAEWPAAVVSVDFNVKQMDHPLTKVLVLP